MLLVKLRFGGEDAVLRRPPVNCLEMIKSRSNAVLSGADEMGIYSKMKGIFGVCLVHVAAPHQSVTRSWQAVAGNYRLGSIVIGPLY